MIIYTGRFQPFHNGHLNLIRTLRRDYPEQTICIAIVKNVEIQKNKSSFDLLTDKQLTTDRNPFDSETVLKLVNLIIREEQLPDIVTTLMPRASIETWPIICALFDRPRIWAFTKNTLQCDEWEKRKIEFYSERGEKVIVLPIEKCISGTDIRDAINRFDYKALESLVPTQVLDYIKRHI